MKTREESRLTLHLAGSETRSNALEPREAVCSAVGDAAGCTQTAEAEGKDTLFVPEVDAGWQVVTERRRRRERPVGSRGRGQVKRGAELFNESEFSTRRGETCLLPNGPRAPDSPWSPLLTHRSPKLVSDTVYRHLSVEEGDTDGDEGRAIVAPARSST